MEPTPNPALVAARATPTASTIACWTVTALFCLQMSFTAYAQLRLPQVAQMFTHLGGVGLGGGHWRALGALVLSLATPGGDTGERVRARRLPPRAQERGDPAFGRGARGLR